MRLSGFRTDIDARHLSLHGLKRAGRIHLGDLLTFYLGGGAGDKLLFLYAVTDYDHFVEHFRILLKSHIEPVARHLYITGYETHIRDRDRLPDFGLIASLDEQLVEKAVKYVEDNISRSDLSVEELAWEMGMSRVHLYKKLSALTGKSPIEFIRLLRLKRATQYLTESQLTIAEIAYKLGCNNPKYFSKYFKDEFGILPSEYQNKPRT